ncbi:metallophosphoesterase [Chryseobacterium sp. JJR-5R]|uniref:metallophosphoesterase n=1 Tax=Chryseobacterium sp. JJR-5R TaxID=3093923 RepID=UPI002A765C5C|nr:metallophosphoesterase [Chryseobacterium sp. JJR-5R]WPO83286.1 metallophosphoesterase [Chryseobacterium sp. JJR-5R]
MDRKTFLKRLAQLSIIGAFPMLYSWQIEPFWLEFVEKKLPVKNLPGDLEGKILMQISDLHVGDRFDWNFLIGSFQKAEKYNPDFVVYTGDFVNHGNAIEREDLKKVLHHAVLGKLGTFGILGNHDYGAAWSEPDVAENICEIAEESGIKMLRNDQKESYGLNFIGFEDLWSPNFFPEKVMENYDPSKANIILCHNPDACDRDVWNGYQDWILSGHTHGGQCRIPGVVTPLVPVKNRNYISGEVDLQDGRMLYINRALGHSIQVRFMVRPEITVFTLTQA